MNKDNLTELPPPKDRIEKKEVEMAEEFLKKVKSGEVTHGAVFFRDKNGTINYQMYNPDHFTYIMGLMERAKIIMVQDYHTRLEENDDVR